MNARLAIVLLALAPLLAAQDDWTELGPAPISSGPYTGRVAAIAASHSDANRYYVGGADGGVWRTDNGGASWQAIGDRLPVTAIGALALHPTDHDVLWVGTGEANFANHSRYGLGIAKTSDGGATWRLLARDTFGGRCISRLRVDRGNPNVLFAGVAHAGGFPARVAARNHPLRDGPLGVFKSSDGGQSWAQLGGGLPGDLSATDVALDPGNGQIVYAALGDIFGDARNGVYKSTNGGGSWTKLAGGLPTTNVGRITLAVAPSNPQRLYASIAQVSDAGGGGAETLGVYRSDNGGASWSSAGPGNYQATYGWYLCTSVVSPTSPDTVLVGGLTCHRSTNAGGAWSTVTPPHVDLHALEFDAASRLLCGNDGGIHRSTNLGTQWTSLNNNLGLIQFYAGLSVFPGQPERIYGGMQDNGTAVRGAGTSWTTVPIGGDGGYTGVDPTGTRVFGESQGTGNLYRQVNGGSFQRSSTGITGRNCFLPPFEIHPLDPLLMIYGTERVFRSTNGATNWSAISPDLTAGGSAAICGLAFAPSDTGTIYVLTNDGRVQVTTDGGQSWRLSRTGVFTWPRTTRPFAVDPASPARAWLAVGAFGVEQILQTDDAGLTWRSIDGDLPDAPAHAVAVDGSSAQSILYVGTDQGVFRSEDGGAHWWRYGRALPHAPVVDLRAEGGRLLAGTQGRGAWQVRLVPRGERLPAEAR
jgi:photosystem II stability/assembly factor-like uncharacterized protein